MQVSQAPITARTAMGTPLPESAQRHGPQQCRRSALPGLPSLVRSMKFMLGDTALKHLP